MQAQRRSKEHSRSTSALSGMADEKSEVSQDADHHMSLYSNGFMASSMGNDPSMIPQKMCYTGMSVKSSAGFLSMISYVFHLQATSMLRL